MNEDLLDTRLRQLSQELHDAAPPVPDWADLVTDAIPTPGDPGHGTSRRWSAFAAAAALVVAVTVGILVVRSTIDPAQPGPATPPRTVPASTATSAPVEPATTLPPPTPTSTSTSTTSTVLPVTMTWKDVAAERAAALASFDSVSFTATVTETYEGQPDRDSQRYNDVTLVNDGSVWATGDHFIVNSYDASTATARLQFRRPDGTIGYQELVGQADNSVPLMVMLGSLDPTSAIWAPDAAVTTGSSNGRDTWQISQSMSPPNEASDSQTNTWTIDRTTGFVVGYEIDWSYDDSGRRAHRSVTLTNLRTGVGLPAEFPGSFPDGATVDRSGDPSIRPITLAEASAEFGSGFVAPTDLPVTRVSLTTSAAQLGPFGAPQVTAPDIRVELTAMNGFNRTALHLRKVRAGDAPPPDGYITIDDVVCRSDDGVTCASRPSNLTIATGAWAGTPATTEGASISASRNGIDLTIVAATPQAALDFAQSLATVTTTPEDPQIATLAIGDDVMMGAAAQLSAAGVHVDAVVSRQLATVVPVVEQLAATGRLGGAVVVHLGNDGTINEADLQRLFTALVGVPKVVVLTVNVPRDYAGVNNAKLTALPASFPNVTVIPWDTLAATCLGDCFYDDGIHLRPDGGAYYSGLILQALQAPAPTTTNETPPNAGD